MMRELVYLSDAKLRQFLPEPRRFFPAGRAKVSVTTPVGGVEVEPGEASDGERTLARRFARVVAHVERGARWFGDEEVRAGQWVAFEAPLNHVGLRGEFEGMLLFADPAEPVEGYERGGLTRLVLHGSAKHLLLPERPLVTVRPRTLEVRGGGGGSGGDGGSAGLAYGSAAAYCVTTEAGYLLPDLAERVDPIEDAPVPVTAVRVLALGTRQLLASLDTQAGAATAAWTRGYARVTANLTDGSDRYLVASPLYVEYAPDLS
jgi:hypothetical protein